MSKPLRLLCWLALLANGPLAAQQTTPGVRVMAQYAILGARSIDTANATRVFQESLAADSLVRVLPRLTPELVRHQGAKIEGASIVLGLSVSGRYDRLLVTVRANDVAAAGSLFREAISTSGDSLLVALDTLGRRAARRIVGRP